MSRRRRARGRSRHARALLAGLVGWVATGAGAGPADVVSARAVCEGERCRFAATIRHADTGWEHYADRFEVLDPDGERLVLRVLRHPHVDEQPFTRATGPVRVPRHVERVRVRAGDSEHGLGGAEVWIDLKRGPGSAPAPSEAEPAGAEPAQAD